MFKFSVIVDSIESQYNKKKFIEMKLVCEVYINQVCDKICFILNMEEKKWPINCCNPFRKRGRWVSKDLRQVTYWMVSLN